MTRFYWILLGFTDVFFKVSLDFTEFYSVSDESIRWVLLGFLVLLDLPGFCWVLLGFIELYLVLLGFTGFYWISGVFTGSLR